MTTSQNLPNTAWPESWLTLDHAVRSGRYTDPEFARLEQEKLWLKAWQVAARLDEVPKPGDHTVYDIGDQSVLIVRLDEDTVKTYHNVCPHRGTALATGPGTFGKDRIICPFHGWRWNLAGENQFVLEQEDFCGGNLQHCDVGLREVKNRVFAGFVFISFAEDPPSFDEFIEPVRELIEDLAIGDMHHYWWKSVAVPANWKVALEAFLEGYHVPATHPQLETESARFIYGDDVSRDFTFGHVNHIYEAFAQGHGRFYGGKSTPMAGNVNKPGDAIDAMADRLNLLVEGMDAMVLKEDVDLIRSLKERDEPIPEGSTLGAEYVKALYANAEASNRPMPKAEPHILDQWGGEVFIFPNFLVLPQAGNCMMYRVRPDGDDPNACIFEIYSTKTYPEAEPVPRASVQKMNNPQDPDQFLQIPRQDFLNIPRMQKGLRTAGCKELLMANYYEKMIVNLHQEVDRYLTDEK